MSWKKILKNEKDASDFIRLAQDNMDKFDKDEKELIKYYIKSLEDKYDRNTFEALKFELNKKELLRRGGPDYGTYQERKAKEVEQYLKGIKNKIMADGEKPSPFLYEAIEMLEEGVITSNSLNNILSEVRAALNHNEGKEYQELKQIESQLERLR